MENETTKNPTLVTFAAGLVVGAIAYYGTKAIGMKIVNRKNKNPELSTTEAG